MKDLDFFSEVGKLKEVPRTGWALRGVENPETVTDHAYRVAVMALHYCKQNTLRCVGMALVHDLPEVITGDVAVRANEKDQEIPSAEKAEQEKAAAKKLFEPQPEMYSLWLEYFENKTPGARLVHDLDKVEMLLQALEYTRDKRTSEDLEEFFESTEPRMQTDKGRELWSEIRRRYLEACK
ncbi:MAG: HD domain-containing protein [Candidatus Diapherotrites archaeon]|nr:HD domain-containing protein [Candidatus Diapherotrites archaeon]